MSYTKIDIDKKIEGFPFIAFEGPPTAGKTLISRRFAKVFSRESVREPTGSILPWFYADISGRALLAQIYFLSKRIEHAKKVCSLVRRGIKVNQDYAFWKDDVYAKVFLNSREYKMYHKLYSSLESFVPKPDVLVFLDCSQKVIMSRLHKRNRKGEAILGPREIRNIHKQTIMQWDKHTTCKIYIDTTKFKIDSLSKAREELFNQVIEKLMEL